MQLADQQRHTPPAPSTKTWFPVSSVSDVDRALGAVRAHLGMDVAFVSEFMGDVRVIRHLDTPSVPPPLRLGDEIPLERGYCQKVVEGRLPQLIPDTAAVPEALEIPETRSLPIGAHLSVPLHLADGRLFGTFCCFSFAPDPSLNKRDLQTMTTFGATLARQIDEDLVANRLRDEKTRRIKTVLADQQPAMVFQPLFRLADMRLNGAEALARFTGPPERTPDKWFDEAREVGLRAELELQAIGKAVEAFQPAWALRPLHLALNCSPQTLLQGGVGQALAQVPLNRIVIEITEHERIDDYEALNRALVPLRQGGARIAVDDAGSGYSSMSHILSLSPDIIKLDVSLTRAIDRDAKRRALAAALISFGRDVDAKVFAEGVESAQALATLRELGADAAQGYHLGRPVPPADFMALLQPEGD
jgi:EAL domain-containing protein (putative c-di-GMP-specific phosphodiesterase class I)